MKIKNRSPNCRNWNIHLEMKKGCSSGKLQAPNYLKLPKKENYGTNVHEVRGSKKVIPS